MANEPDPDADALLLYQIASLDPHLPQHPIALAEALPWISHVEIVGRTEVWGLGESTAIGTDCWEILIVNMPPAMEAFVLAHEIAETWAARCRYAFATCVEKERYCDATAAALIAPRPAFREALAEHGSNFPALATDFATTETLCALRLGEVRDVPLAVVGPRVHVRGPEWGWPPTEQLRRMAELPPHPGLRRTRLHDDPRRVVLYADTAA